MGLVYMLDLGNEKVKIELLKVKHFCRYCNKLNQRCLKQHRAGTLWLIKAIDYCTRYYVITDGEIPPEHSEEFNELNCLKETDSVANLEHYITGSGWIVPKSVIELSEEEFKELSDKIDCEPTEYDLQCLMHRLLGKYKSPQAPVTPPSLLILTIMKGLDIMPEDITKIELSWLRRTYKKWLDDSTKYEANMNIKIKRIPKSFGEQIIFPSFGVSFENKKYATTVEKDYTDIKVYNIFTKSGYNIQLIAIYVEYNKQHKALYYKVIDRLWKGREIYYQHIHPECTLYPIDIDKLKYELIYRRLGDIMFLDYPLNTNNIFPATKEQLKKVTIVNGKIEEVNKDDATILKLVKENEELPIQVIHPEHGSIDLCCSHYYIYTVPYLEAGHD